MQYTVYLQPRKGGRRYEFPNIEARNKREAANQVREKISAGIIITDCGSYDLYAKESSQ